MMRQIAVGLLGMLSKVKGVLTRRWALFLGFFRMDSFKSHTDPTRWILLTSPFKVDKDGFYLFFVFFFS